LKAVQQQYCGLGSILQLYLQWFLPFFGASLCARPLWPFPEHMKAISSTSDSCACEFVDGDGDGWSI